MLKRTKNDDPDFIGLRKALDEELWEMYPEILQLYVEHNVLPESTDALVYFKNGQPVACGAFKPIATPRAIEIKRMYVSPAARGQGLGKVILDGLEEWGFELGFDYCVLETGLLNFAAHKLYERSGYVRISNYPPFEGMDESWCYGKQMR